MKKLLLPISLLAVTVGVNAQTYFSDDFSSGNLNNWTLTDSDGDGSEWMIRDYDDGAQEEHASSASWNPNAETPAGPLNPDNWMVSSGIAIPGGATNVQLLWKVYGQDQSYADENYTVYVATAADIATLGASSTNFNEVVGTSTGYESRGIDLTAFAGQTVYVAFRHHNVSDQFRLNIDDVEVKSVPPVDMEMTTLTNASTVVAGNVNITGTVTSYGADNITSIDITYDAGAGAVTQTNVPVNLNYGDSYNFTHSTPLNAAAGTTYNVTVSVVASGDADNTNDSQSTTISAVSSLVPKVTVGEEKTGEWCGWCPRGAVALANMSISNPDDFIGIAVHNGDAMAVAAYDGNINTYIPGGYPGGGVDRVVNGNPADFAQMHAQRSGEIPPASIATTLTSDGTTVTSEVTATFVGGLSGDYRLAVVLIQDGVAGAGQANYYNDGAAGAMAMPNTGSMPNLDFVGAGATVTPFLHDHVGVALGDNEINGAAGSLPGTINDGDVETHTYTFTQAAGWDMSKMHAVGMLVNATTGEILNAGKADFVGLNELEATNFAVTAVPNPSNGLSNLVIDLEEAADVNISVVNILGEVVYQYDAGQLTAGSYQTPVNLSNEANGVYLARVSVNGQVQTIKLNVTK